MCALVEYLARIFRNRVWVESLSALFALQSLLFCATDACIAAWSSNPKWIRLSTDEEEANNHRKSEAFHYFFQLQQSTLNLFNTAAALAYTHNLCANSPRHKVYFALPSWKWKWSWFRLSPVICYSVCTCWTSTCYNRSLEQPPRDYNWLLFLSKRKNSRRRIVRIGSGAFSWHCRRFLSLVVLREQIFIMIELCG